MLQELPMRQAAMAEELESLQRRVEEVAAGLVSWNGTSSMAQQMQAIEGQLHQLQGDRGPGAEDYSAFATEVRDKLHDLQQQLMAGGRDSGGSSPAS